MTLYCEPIAQDVAAASGSVLYNLLPQLVSREPQEVHDSLKSHVDAAIRAYCDLLQGWSLDPSGNAGAIGLPNVNHLLARITELRDRVNSLHQLAGPELRKFMDTYDFPFSTTNAMLAFGQRLLKGVINAKQIVVQLGEVMEGNSKNAHRAHPHHRGRNERNHASDSPGLCSERKAGG